MDDKTVSKVLLDVQKEYVKSNKIKANRFSGGF